VRWSITKFRLRIHGPSCGGRSYRHTEDVDIKMSLLLCPPLAGTKPTDLSAKEQTLVQSPFGAPLLTPFGLEDGTFAPVRIASRESHRRSLKKLQTKASVLLVPPIQHNVSQSHTFYLLNSPNKTKSWQLRLIQTIMGITLVNCVLATSAWPISVPHSGSSPALWPGPCARVAGGLVADGVPGPPPPRKKRGLAETFPGGHRMSLGQGRCRPRADGHA
jgi:hypothetical protein